MSPHSPAVTGPAPETITGTRRDVHMLISCFSTEFSQLRDRWQKGYPLPEVRADWIGVEQRPHDPPGGLLVLADTGRGVTRTLPVWMPSGLLHVGESVLVASQWGIHALDLASMELHANVVTHPLCNALHSLRPSRRGFLAASSGTDSVLEFSLQGELLWRWTATEHGFDTLPSGGTRHIDVSHDYRGLRETSSSHTTHLNCAAELDDDIVLVCLFHQGLIIAVDRATGDWEPVLSGLKHPHGIRVLDPDRFTVADTGNGRALVVKRVADGWSARPEQQFDTNWLQDVQHADTAWIHVDGQHSRIEIVDEAGTRQIQMDSEWRPYEALVIPSPAHENAD